MRKPRKKTQQRRILFTATLMIMGHIHSDIQILIKRLAGKFFIMGDKGKIEEEIKKRFDALAELTDFPTGPTEILIFIDDAHPDIISKDLSGKINSMLETHLTEDEWEAYIGENKTIQEKLLNKEKGTYITSG